MSIKARVKKLELAAAAGGGGGPTGAHGLGLASLLNQSTTASSQTTEQLRRYVEECWRQGRGAGLSGLLYDHLTQDQKGGAA